MMHMQTARLRGLMLAAIVIGAFGFGSAWAAMSISVHPSPAVVDAGHNITLTAAVSGNSVPYTYYLWTGNASCLFSPSVDVEGMGSSITVSPSANMTYCVTAFASGFDSNSGEYASATVHIALNPALSAGPITPGALVADRGQGIALAAHPSGGSPPYSIEWFPDANCTGTGIGAGYGLTASPSSNTVYSYSVVDSASEPHAECSAPAAVTINPPLSVPTVSVSSATAYPGQDVLLTASGSGGTPPYSYQWYIGEPPAGAAIAGATDSSYNAAQTDTTEYYVSLRDSAASPETSNSVPSRITVGSATQAPASVGAFNGTTAAGTPVVSNTAAGNAANGTGGASAGAIGTGAESSQAWEAAQWIVPAALLAALALLGYRMARRRKRWR